MQLTDQEASRVEHILEHALATRPAL